MNRSTLGFLNGETNVLISGDIIITREQAPGAQHITIKIAGTDNDIELYKFWHSNKPPAATDKPKHTGGRSPYLMLMINEVEKLREQGVKNVEELLGVIVCLGKNIEWNTGKLIHKRTKKPLKYEDLQGIFKFGNRKLNRIIANLKEHNLLYHTKEGYFIATNLIKKGKMKGANRDGQ